MTLHFLRFGFRNLKKHKVYSLINILGLGAGVAISCLTFLMVSYELSYDRFHTSFREIYRIHQKFNDGGTTANVAYPIKNALLRDYKQIKAVSQFLKQDEIRLLVNKRQEVLHDFLYSDADFFSIFTCTPISGDLNEIRERFLKGDRVAVLTKSARDSIFKNSDWKENRLLFVDTGVSYEVIAIIEDFPLNSHFHFSGIVPIITHPQYTIVEDDWNFPIAYTYMHIPNKDSASLLTISEMDQFIRRHFPERFGGPDAHLPVVPLSGVHLEPGLHNQLKVSHSVNDVFLFGAVGIVVLIMACLNFMNLSTSNTISRVREIAIRRTLGADDTQLISQILAETVLITSVSFILAAGFILLGFNTFFHLTDTQVNLSFISSYHLIFFVALFTVVTLTCAIYPCYHYIRFDPGLTLAQYGFNGDGDAVYYRKILVVVQLSILTTLLLGVVALDQQIKFLSHLDLGYEHEDLVTFRSSESVYDDPVKYASWMAALKTNNNVIATCGVADHMYSTIEYEGMEYGERKGGAALLAAPNYMQVLQTRLLNGRYPNPTDSSDRNKALINQMAASVMGWKGDQALGKLIRLFDGDSTYEVIGVFEDFLLMPPTSPIEATVYIPIYEKINYRWTTARLSPRNKQETIAFIQDSWNQYGDGWPFQVLSEKNRMAKGSERLEKLFDIFLLLTLTSLLISVLGLYGLSSITVRKKSQEIAVRKVLGATGNHIWYLVSKEFLLILVPGSIAGTLIGYFLISILVQDYYFRAEFGLGIYMITLFMTISIGLLTVASRVFNSAFLNPIQILRSE